MDTFAFRKAQQTISKELSPDETRRICTFVRMTAAERTDKVSICFEMTVFYFSCCVYLQPLTMLETLIHNYRVSNSNYAILEKALIEIGRFDLVRLFPDSGRTPAVAKLLAGA
jgi:hypothetical protein